MCVLRQVVGRSFRFRSRGWWGRRCRRSPRRASSRRSPRTGGRGCRRAVGRRSGQRAGIHRRSPRAWPIVPTRRDPPRPTGRGLKLGEVQPPHLVRARRLPHHRRLAALGQAATFPLTVCLQNQALIAQQQQHGRLQDPVPVVAGHRPDPPMTPRPMPGRAPDHDITARNPDPPPRALRR